MLEKSKKKKVATVREVKFVHQHLPVFIIIILIAFKRRIEQKLMQIEICLLKRTK